MIEIASQAKESEDATALAAALDEWTIEIGGRHHFSKFLHSFGHLAKTRGGGGERRVSNGGNLDGGSRVSNGREERHFQHALASASHS